MMSRLSAEIATACLTATLGLVICVGALEFGIGWGSAGPEPGAFPFYIGLLITGASIGTVAQTVATRRDGETRFLDSAQAKRVIAFLGPMALFLVLAVILGLYVATALYLFGVMWLQGKYRPDIAIIVGMGAAVFFFVVLEMGFKVTLMKGPLEAALGLS